MTDENADSTLLSQASAPVRAPAWRLLDTAGGIAIGIVLVLSVQWWVAAPHTAVAAQPTVTANTTIWQAGPRPGCVLTGMWNEAASNGHNTDTYQILASWDCPHALPPALVTPTPH